MNDKEPLHSLFQQYLLAQCTPEEIDQILDYFGAEAHSDSLKELIAQHLSSDEEFDVHTQQGITNIVSETDQRMQAFVRERTLLQPRRTSRRLLWTMASSAAAVLLALGIGIYTYLHRAPESQEERLAEATTIRAIGNGATLTLADGSIISLSEDQSGIVVGENNIAYSDGTTIRPQATSTEVEQPARFLTLSTPRGAQYQVTLPDGSKVWLNAASKLSYPERFTGSERKVALEGEAYFEVASNKQKPFRVSSKGQEVEVLGTHFNIQAYAEDSETKTTLVEGAVQVSIPVISIEAENSEGLNAVKSVRSLSTTNVTKLKPRQQAVLHNGKLRTQTVNTDDFASWKDNVFIFHNTDLKTIMRQISRWYDVEVDLANLPDVEFYAEIPRHVPLSQVLIMLEETSQMRFRLVSYKKGQQTERRLHIEL